MLGVGASVPDFVLQATDRERVGRAYFEGAPGILAFYPKAFSGG